MRNGQHAAVATLSRSMTVDAARAAAVALESNRSFQQPCRPGYRQASCQSSDVDLSAAIAHSTCVQLVVLQMPAVLTHVQCDLCGKWRAAPHSMAR